MDERINGRILIVDDNSHNVGILYDYLSRQNYEVMVARSAEQMFKQLGHIIPDVILLDVMMPGMNGFEACQRLATDENTMEIPVILITALDDLQYKVQGFESGAVDYITKPFQQKEVLMRVQTHLELKRIRQELLADRQRVLEQKDVLTKQAAQLETAYQQLEAINIELERSKLEIEREKARSEQLLLNVLPQKIVNDLKNNGISTPESFENVTLLFSDIVGFTPISVQLGPELLISELNDIYTGFDDIMTKHNCERIETVGDAYLAVCGLPVPDKDHARKILWAASDMIRFLRVRNELAQKSGHQAWEIRIGVHTGDVVGGVVGVRKYAYHIFGDAVNTASRMESNSEPMRINVSETTYALAKQYFSFIHRGGVDVKGKGAMDMYFLEADLSAEQTG